MTQPPQQGIGSAVRPPPDNAEPAIAGAGRTAPAAPAPRPDAGAPEPVALPVLPVLPALPALPALPPFPGLPSDADGPVFAQPWQAQAFAMTLALHAKGLFTWSEWAHALALQIAQAQAGGDADLGDTYYGHWLAALETLVAAKGASTADELQRHRQAWDHAADRTPHGQPIQLRADDFNPLTKPASAAWG